MLLLLELVLVNLCSCVTWPYCIEQGKNVLYVTLEMSEERITERIDANMSMCQSKT